MDTVIAYVISGIDMVILIGCALSIMHVVPGNVEAKRWKKVIAWVIYGVLAWGLPRFIRWDPATVVGLTLWSLLMAYLLYFRNSLGMVCQVIYNVLLVAAQYLGSLVASGIYSVFPLDNQIFFYLFMILRWIFQIGATFALWEVVRKRFTDMKHMKMRGMALVPIFSLVLFFLYVISGEVFFVRYGTGWLIVFTVLLVALNLYCLYFWYDVEKNREFKHRLELMQQQKDMTVQYYEEMERNYNESRRIIHDIRNHLHAIEQKYKIEDREYIEDVHDMLNSMGMKFYTENKMLNIVLNDKLKAIPVEQVDCNLGGIGLEFISDIDITTIFANLLVNAVEAGTGHKDFWIKIRGEEIQDFTIVKISNPLFVPYKEGRSAKAGHEGIGLQNVRQAVEKYDGQMEIQTEEDIFSVTILFANKNGETKWEVLR